MNGDGSYKRMAGNTAVRMITVNEYVKRSYKRPPFMVSIPVLFLIPARAAYNSGLLHRPQERAGSGPTYFCCILSGAHGYS